MRVSSIRHPAAPRRRRHGAAARLCARPHAPPAAAEDREKPRRPHRLGSFCWILPIAYDIVEILYTKGIGLPVNKLDISSLVLQRDW